MSRQAVRQARVAESQITDHVRALVQGMDLRVDGGRVRAVPGARRVPKAKGTGPETPVRNTALSARPDHS